jgi:integrase
LGLKERIRFLASLAEVRPEDRIQALAVKMLYYTGGRTDDVLSLQWRDVQDDAIYLDPDSTKTHMAKIFMTQELRDILNEARALRQTPIKKHQFVFPASLDKPEVGLPNIYDVFNEIMKRANIKKFTPHQLRHNYVTECERMDLTGAEKRVLTRHADDRTADHYTHAFPEDIMKAAEDVGEQLTEELWGGEE